MVYGFQDEESFGKGYLGRDLSGSDGLRVEWSGVDFVGFVRSEKSLRVKVGK